MSDNRYLGVVVAEERLPLQFIAAAAIFSLVLLLALLSVAGALPRLVIIQSSSMVPTLKPGDLVLIRSVEPATIQVGDIVAFNYVASDFRDDGRPVNLRRVPLIVHRVVEVVTVNGAIYLKTKGDNNPAEDPWYVPASGVMGAASKVASLGQLGLVLTSPIGKALVLVFTLSVLYLAITGASLLRGGGAELDNYV